MSVSDPIKEALDYHSGGRRPGKIEVHPTKPMETSLDLGLAYSPGVAHPCNAIAADPEKAWDYTSRGNLVAVVTNGTAVLGLGDLGPGASKPVMEGKAALFKKFADIDVFDLEVDADPEGFIKVVKALEPTFGGINLEDIRAPEAFYIEETLKKQMAIPVFHDDQHGTAIIASAALINGLELQGKSIGEVKVVVIGAGAAGCACAALFISLGVQAESLLMVDVDGVLREGDERLDKWRRRFARKTERRTMAEALVGADVMVGLSAGNIVSGEMVKAMAPKPLIFALANPTSEIPYDVAREARPDAIIATGRSDFPNQCNNVLGFPFIFRGALDVRASEVNEAMKAAAVHALAQLAREPVPGSVVRAYGGTPFEFGRDYIIPKPFDPRVIGWVAPSVAKAAVDSGVARRMITDWEAYRVSLESMMDPGRSLVRQIIDKAKRDPKRLVLPESDDPRVLKAAVVLARNGIAKPVLIGTPSRVRRDAEALGLDLGDIEIISPQKHEAFEQCVGAYLTLNQRRGITRSLAERHIRSRSRFGLMMVCQGSADCIVVGATKPYSEALRPALQMIGAQGRACGMYVVLTRDRTLFFADTTVTVDPTAEEIAEITLATVDRVRKFDITPRVALLSFANFGSVKDDMSAKMAKARALIKSKEPHLMIEGEVQVDLAVDMALRERSFPWSELTKPANVFIFPNLAAANIAYKMLHQFGNASLFGPILLGMNRPVHVLPLNVDVSDIVNLAAYAVVSAQDSPMTRACSQKGPSRPD